MKKIDTPQCVFLSYIVLEPEKVFNSTPDFIHTYKKSYTDDTTLTSIPVAYCPYCHKMELISSFFVPLEGKEEVTDDPIFMLKAAVDDKTRKDFFKQGKSTVLPFEVFIPSRRCSFISRCPNCGTDLSSLPQKYLVSARYSIENVIINSYNIYKKENKIILNVSYKYLFPNTKVGKIAISFFDVFLSINLETGHSYITTPRKNGKPIAGKYSIMHAGKSFDDCTYYNYKLLKPVNALFSKNKDILRALKKFFLKNKETKYDYHRKKLSLEQIIYLNRFPSFDLKTINSIKDILQKPSFFNYDPQIRSKHLAFFRSIKANEPFEVMNVINRLNLPNKPKLRKHATENPLVLFDFYWVKKLPFKDYNIQFSIVENYNKLLPKIATSKEALFFLKALIKRRREASSYKCVFTPELEKDVDMLLDAASMYISLLGNIPKIDLSGSIRDIHDRFSELYFKLKKPNQVFSYSKKERLLEDDINSISFSLPIDSCQLINVGEKMHICVGSYSSAVFLKDCIIIVMKKDNKYVGCLELSSTGKRLIQAKSFCNNALEKDEAVALSKYVKKHNINTKNCFDYNRLKL